ncbi:MAG: zinc ribbon domain-containing protein [Promethearchaeota archaeon]
MGLIEKIIHSYELKEYRDRYHYNDEISGEFILESFDNKPIKLKSIEIHCEEYYEIKVKKPIPSSKPGLIETIDDWELRRNTLSKYKLEKGVVIEPNKIKKISFKIKLPDNWQPKKGEKIKNWGLGLFFYHMTKSNLSLGAKMVQSTFFIPVLGTAPSLLSSALSVSKRGYLPSEVIKAIERALDKEEEEKAVKKALKEAKKQKLDKADKIMLKAEKLKVKKEEKAKKIKLKEEKKKKIKLEKKGEGVGLTKELKKSRKKWEKKISKPFSEEKKIEKEIKEEKYEVETIINKCPKCNWLLSSSAKKCPRCGWKEGDIVFPD